MATSSMLKASGLHTFNSYLSSIPEGALFVAENVNIDRSGVVEPRRGISQFAELPDTDEPAKQLLIYKDKLFAHYKDKLAKITENTVDIVLQNSNSVTELSITEAQDKLRIKSVEANGNLYLTTSQGILRFSSNRELTDYETSLAGGIKAFGVQAFCDYSQSGFLPKYSKVAYRVTWGKKDKNDNFIEGAPSPSIEVTNVADKSCSVTLLVDVPSQILTDATYFFRVYRTDVFSSTDFEGLDAITVNDELKLVFELGHDGVTTQYTVSDIAPTFFRDSQVPLYTNEFSGEGILQANEAPPFALDVALYQNYTFYANTRQKHSSLLTLLGATKLVSIGAQEDTVKITAITSGPTSVITTSAAHNITIGSEIIIFHTDGMNNLVDAKYTVANVTTTAPHTITVNADIGITNIVTAKPTIHSSSFTIQKGALPIQKYFFVGRQEVQDLVFTGYTNAPDRLIQYPHKSYFTLFSAGNLIKYVVYFFTDASPSADITPPSVSDAVFIKVDMTDQDTRTAEEVANKVLDAILSNTKDIVGSVTGGTLTTFTNQSGTANISVNAGVVGLTSITNIQEGYGENTSKQYITIPKDVSAGVSTFFATSSLVRVINSNPNEQVNAYFLFDPNGLGGRFQLEAKVLDETPFVVNGTSPEIPEIFNPALSNVTSTNERRANRLYYSKVSQPDAVPLVNFIDIGPRDEAILRIVALRDSMFIFKEKSIYRLAGDNPNNFLVVIHDNSAALITSDALSVLNNSIYALTTQGISQISDTGMTVVSRPIEDKITKITAPRFRSKLHTIFAASYEQDRAFFLWIPKLETEDYATECYRLNVFTNTWTSWDVNATATIVVTAENVLYKAAGDVPIIEKERKQLNRTDYADRQFDTLILPDAFAKASQKLVKMGDISNIQKGDTLVQTQYVTISQINRLMARLQSDPTLIGDVNYIKFIEEGSSVAAFLTDLQSQLLADLYISGPALVFSDSNLAQLQVQYNLLIDKINVGNLTFKNYQKSTGSKQFELIVEKVISADQEISVLAITPIVEGPIVLYKSIRSEVIYAPIAFGEPALMKHIRAGTMMFANADLAFGNLSYSTDLSPNYEGVDFTLEGDGSWGIFFYSSTSWGGEGTQRPFRTLIPRQKQRCRFIRPRFVHNTAFYKYLLYGVSFDLEVTNSRGYR